MNMNKDITNIILNYIKPLYYLKDLQESIKNIKYNDVFYYNILGLKNHIQNSIVKENNKWKRHRFTLQFDYRLAYLYSKEI
jgi:hypothetical protein